jgi:hypothetical protein
MRVEVLTDHGGSDLASTLSILPDDWVMLRGYRNRRGTTDHVLVGPRGVWTVEVKRRPVRLNVIGDRWWHERFDARGRLIERGRAVDSRGRSWARQVNDIADNLARWLARKRHETQVRTAVMLLHEQAMIGRCEHLGVDLLSTDPRHLLDALGRRPPTLSAEACKEIVDLVRRHHRS